jgi:hypothetical protein
MKTLPELQEELLSIKAQAENIISDVNSVLGLGTHVVVKKSVKHRSSYFKRGGRSSVSTEKKEQVISLIEKLHNDDKMSYSEIARHVGLHNTSVHNILKARSMSANTADAILKAFGTVSAART